MEKMDAKDEVESELDEYTQRQREYERQRENREEIRNRLSRTEAEVETTEETLDTLTERKEELMEEVESLEADVESLESDSYGDVLDLHREANELEYELGRLETERDEVAAEIEEIEAEIEREDEIETRREELQEELVELRTRIDRIESEAVEEFNEHIGRVLSILDYENVERIWIEMVEQEVREGRRKTTRNRFELHVVRSSESGVAYEDTVDHLSESEREVTGLVFALAGYLVHDMHESVPFMIVDALEPIDSDRIAALVDYFSSHVDYFVVALLQEDAEALDVDHHRVAEVGVPEA